MIPFERVKIVEVIATTACECSNECCTDCRTERCEKRHYVPCACRKFCDSRKDREPPHSDRREQLRHLRVIPVLRGPDSNTPRLIRECSGARLGAESYGFSDLNP